MSELPAGWMTTTLEVATKVIRGITFPATAKEPVPTAENVCCLRTANIQKEVTWGDVYYVDRQYVKREEQFVQAGDILMSMANSYELVGKVAHVKSVPSSTAFGAFLSAVRPTPVIDGRYLFHFLRSDRVQLELREGSSQTTNIANISVGRLNTIALPLAPRAEQTRIADQLDTLLARIKACNDHLDTIPGLLKRFRQAVLELGLSGDLNTVLREGSAIERDAWTPTTLGEIAGIGTGSTPLRSNGSYFAPSGTPWITSAATGSRYVDQAQEYVTPAAIAAHRLKVYPPGTLLVAMYGEGKTRGQVSELRIHATINQACAAVTVDTALARTAFVKLALLVQYEQMRAMAEGGNQPNLNLSKVKAIPILLPPLREQDEIIRSVESLLRQAEAIEVHYNAIREQAHRLPSQVLTKAFRGELVPQDPNDEPASALLARISAATVQAAAPARKRKPKTHAN
ncbi:restriction endonuclease subunit S [Ideonella sp.]|uniref:restriction endonuclease subunit S n=1 Tax=Ideonella sp. TaxID=1929293 RepID=UPI0037BFE714